MGKWKVSLVALIGVLLLAFALYALNNKTANKAPANTTQTSSTQNSSLKVVNPDSNFVGQENLAKYEGLAKKNANSAADQANAAISSFVNQDYNKAVEYYKRAVALDPKNAQYLTYLGNVYNRGLESPQEAVKYYQAAIKYNPEYAYGWLNLAQCQVKLGNKNEAKTIIQKGIASVDPKDPILKQLKQELDSIK